MFAPRLWREATNEKRRKCSIHLCPLVSMATQRWDQGSCILLQPSPLPPLSLGRQSRGLEKCRGGEKQKMSRETKEEKEGRSGRDDAASETESYQIMCCCLIGKWSIYGDLGWLSENWSPFCFLPKKTPLPVAHRFPLLLVDPLVTFISVIFVVATAFIEIYRVARRCLLDKDWLRWTLMAAGGQFIILKTRQMPGLKRFGRCLKCKWKENAGIFDNLINQLHSLEKKEQRRF